MELYGKNNKFTVPFGKKKRKKIGQSDYCWKYISLYVTFPWSYSLPY